MYSHWTLVEGSRGLYYIIDAGGQIIDWGLRFDTAFNAAVTWLNQQIEMQNRTGW